jgi:superfamily I DNA and/or RNA helicase
MNISGLHSAKGLKFKLRADIMPGLKDAVVTIDKTDNSLEFFVKTRNGNADLFTAEKKTAWNINELLEIENNHGYRNLFVVEDMYPVNNEYCIEVQGYTFASITDYTTPITIQVPENFKYDTNILYDMFVYNGIGMPAIFALRYKNKKKTDIRLIAGNKFLNIKNTSRGFIIEKIDSRRDRTILPIDIYLAPKIEFVPESTKAGNNELFAKDLDTFSNAASYFSRWEAYNELTKKEIIARSEEFGKAPYTRYERHTTEGGYKFTFYINDEIDKSYLGETIGVFNAAVDHKGNQRDVRVGKINKIYKDKIETFLERDDIVDIPVSGTLVLSQTGDMSIIKRREKAKNRMVSLKSPIKYIVPLIEKGASEFSSESNWTNNKSITAELEKNFKQAKKLNKRQKDALELAINTPDIALIQGPPGTGKTTVIKAICERFREIFEKENNGERPTILISSFQNEAVDNAVSNPIPGELPAYRIGKKREESFKKITEDWVEKVETELVQRINNNKLFEFGGISSRLSDTYFVYKHTGEKPTDGIKLINEYLSIPGIKYPEPLKETANKIIAKYQQHGNSPVVINDDPFFICLKEQRLTKESFNDDGYEKVKKLRAHLKIRSDLNIEKTYIDAINAAADNGISDNNIFEKYKKAVNALIKIYIPASDQFNPVKTNQIDKCLQELALAFYNGRLNASDNLDDKKALIIGEFLDRFKDEADTLIGKYSLTTAATCQLSMPLFGQNDPSYDMVIVDEAARAIPLDLFIPMSMGRKIILVGDHKQLPHMLEPEVLKLIMDDPQYKDLPQLDISLFERLFTMFNSGIRPKSILLDTQYRMHPDICQFVSEAFYEDKLKSGISAEDRVIPQDIFGGRALVYVNVSRNKGVEEGRMSKSRVYEARYIAKDINKLLDICPDKTVGVITFYSAQVNILEEEIRKVLNDNQYSKVELGTVDAFQGKEFDYVFLSCVRSNTETEEKKSIGFLVKENRICVALSRAKYQLAIYGDAQTINAVKCFKLLYEKCKNRNEGYYYEY